MVAENYLPRTGGTERQLSALAAALTARDVHVEVLTARRRDAWPLEEDVAGVRVHRLPYPRVRVIGTIVLLLRAASFLLRGRRRFDVFHVHAVGILAVLTVVMGRALRRPVVLKPVGARELEHGVLNAVVQRALRSRAMLAILRHADAWIAVSRHLRLSIEHAGVPVARIRMIPNGVDTDHFAPPPSSRAPARPVTAGLRVLFVGRLVDEKAVPVLLRAWAIVVRRAPTATLDIVGDGPRAAVLRTLAAELGLGTSVSFHGFHDDVRPFLQAADVFVLTSSVEGLSNALLEAMAAGLPVVATRIGGTEEVVVDGETGLLVSPAGADAFAEALIALLEAPERRKEMGARGRRRVVARYDISLVATIYLRLYQDVLGPPRH